MWYIRTRNGKKNLFKTCFSFQRILKDNSKVEMMKVAIRRFEFEKFTFEHIPIIKLQMDTVEIVFNNEVTGIQ